MNRHSANPLRGVAIGALFFCAAVAFLATSAVNEAEANAPIFSFKSDSSSTQAGGHPDLVTEFEIGTIKSVPQDPVCFCAAAKDIIVNSPAGLIGNPHSIPRCTAAEFATERCPSDSQAGVVVARLELLQPGYHVKPLYNMVPFPNQAGLLNWPQPITNYPAYEAVASRTESDYGLEIETSGISRLASFYTLTQTIWGVPASQQHDALRIPTGSPVGYYCEGNPLSYLADDEAPPPGFCLTGGYSPVASNSPDRPFLSNPTSCVGPLTATMDTLAYDLEYAHADSPHPATIGCDQLSFDPSLSALPTTIEADSPSGLEVDLKVPQFQSPTSPSPSSIRATRVTLPPGFTINPNAADGKTACSDAAARFGTRLAAQCPEFSKLATIGIDSSALPGILPGYAYLGAPLPGNRYRVFLVADGFEVHVKLAGVATPDPKTGQLKVSFEDLPQTPFQEFDLHFFGAEKGLLATPTHCGTYEVKSEFEPWAAPEIPNQTSTQFFTIDSGPGGSPCPPAQRPFDPGVSAGVTNNTGGSHTDFVFNLERRDGDQNLISVDVSTPPGFSGVLAGIPKCSEASLASLEATSYLGATQQSSPVCPNSQVGTASASAGAGSRPIHLPGKVYLAGPYKGAPLSLAVVTPAVSGPYDLGNVVVRIAVNVNPLTARVSATADPLPQIREGIPLRLREVLVELNRPNFALNPTNCSPLTVDAQISGDQGAVAQTSNHFQVANCGALDFAPKLSLKLIGSTKRRGHPALRAVYRAASGQANLAGTTVAMPKAELLDQAHIGTVCTRVQYAADSCPAASIYGQAMAQTPLLDGPLTGPVYLRSSSNKLPDLVVALRGEFDIDLVGKVDTAKGGGLRTTFESAPDAPVSKFVLNLAGGAKGLLFNSEDLCRSPQKANVSLRGQNGLEVNRRIPLQTSCSKGRKSKKQKRAKRTGRVG